MEKTPILPKETADTSGIECKLPDLTEIPLSQLQLIGGEAVEEALEAAKKEAESGAPISGFQSVA